MLVASADATSRVLDSACFPHEASVVEPEVMRRNPILGGTMTIRNLRATALLTQSVFTRDGQPQGSVVGALVDAVGTPRYIEVRRHRFERSVRLIPARDIEITDDGVVVPYEHGDVANAPTAPEAQTVSYAVESTICRHFGVPMERWIEERDGWADWAIRDDIRADTVRHLRSAQAESGNLVDRLSRPRERRSRLRRVC